MMRMVRKSIIAAIAVVLLAGAPYMTWPGMTLQAEAASAGSQITVMGKAIQSDSPSIIDGGRVLIPLRVVAEAFGAAVQWDAETSTATVRRWSVTARFEANSLVAVIDRELSGSSSHSTVHLDAPMKLYDNRAYVPLRFLGSQFGYQVSWHDHIAALDSKLRAEEQLTLHEGELKDARHVANGLGGDLYYTHDPLPSRNYVVERDGVTTLFPEGEALRFYKFDGDVVSQVEIKDDFAVVTWQASLDCTACTKEAAFQSFMNRQWTDDQGIAPNPSGDYVYSYFRISGPESWEEYGYVDADGKMTQTGYGHYNSIADNEDTKTGTLEIVKPGEQRTDVLK